MKKARRDKTINELRAEAKKEGIKLRRAMKKEEILRALEKKKSRDKTSSRGVAARQRAAREKTVRNRHAEEAGKGRAESVLPEEYGENDLFLIAVDPHVVYASWEIKREDLPHRGGLKMRLFDVTGIESVGDGGERFLDINLAKRVGSGFFELRMNGREVIAEIGNVRGGRFVPILRSHRVSFPMPFPCGGSGIQGESEPGTPIGY